MKAGHLWLLEKCDVTKIQVCEIIGQVGIKEKGETFAPLLSNCRKNKTIQNKKQKQNKQIKKRKEKKRKTSVDRLPNP